MPAARLSATAVSAPGFSVTSCCFSAYPLSAAVTRCVRAADKLGLKQAREFFADRTYDDNGQLTSRKVAGSVLHDAAFAAERVLRTLGERAITTVNGVRLPVAIDTICVHGDKPSAVAMARAVRAALEKAGITVKPFIAA